MDAIIYHICETNLWKEQEQSETYTHASLLAEGFIHCSKESQISGVLERYFEGDRDLQILAIDPTLLSAKCIEEVSTQGELFPHIYGTINKTAIVEITPLIKR